MDEYQRGTAIYFEVAFTDFDGTPASPTDVFAKIYKGDALIDTLTPVDDGDGEFHAIWQSKVTDAIGVYVVEWGGTIDDWNLVERVPFELKHQKG